MSTTKSNDVQIFDFLATDKISPRQLRRRMARFGTQGRRGAREVTTRDMRLVTIKKKPETRSKAFLDFVNAF